MTENEADMLARRIVNIWRSTPSLHEWRDKLVAYDYDQALDTLRTLRDEVDGATLTIARYHAAHRGHTAPTSSSTPNRCELCDGTGWIQGPGHEAHGHRYSNVVHCRCRTMGQ